jgi:hypothetical protein
MGQPLLELPAYMGQPLLELQVEYRRFHVDAHRTYTYHSNTVLAVIADVEVNRDTDHVRYAAGKPRPHTAPYEPLQGSAHRRWPFRRSEVWKTGADEDAE